MNEHRNSDEETERLVNENMALARFMACRQMDIDLDEAFSKAMKGLLKAAQRYDAGNVQGCTFGTFAAMAMKAQFSIIRKRRAAIKRGSQFQTIPLDFQYEDGDSIAERIEDPSAFDPNPDENQLEKRPGMIELVLPRLKDRQREIIRRRYGIGCTAETQQQIGDSLNVTRQRIEQIEKEALKKLRQMITGEDCKKLIVPDVANKSIGVGYRPLQRNRKPRLPRSRLKAA